MLFVVAILAAVCAGADPVGVDPSDVMADSSLSAIPDTVAIDSMDSRTALTDSLQAIASKIQSLKDVISELLTERWGALSGRITSARPDNMPIVHPDTSGLGMPILVPEGHFPMPIVTPDGWQDAGDRVTDNTCVVIADSTEGSE